MGTRACATLRPVARLLALFALVLTLAGCGEEDPPKGPDLPSQLEQLTGAPPKLARLHRQANQLLDGGPDAFKKQLEELRGYPIVINKWASWCAPCRAEFPTFARVAAKLGKRIAFLGVDGNDNDANAREFLDEYPVSYPSFKDPTLKIVELMKATFGFPATVFYDSKGEVAYLKHGPYREDAELVADIERYAK